MKLEDKQTAVEWLFRALWDEPKDKLTWWAIFDEAMEIEKQQLEQAYRQGYKRCSYIKSLMDDNWNTNDQPIPKDFKTYYDDNYAN